jgi:hypothetical protein
MQIYSAKIAFPAILLATAVVAFAADAPTKPRDPWVIHEWGTFTSLQDEAGRTIGGINTDDEPVPEFVHRLAYFLLLSPTEVPKNFFQGAPSCHPDVTMRLETPVLYFHPPPLQPEAQGINVTATFRGGWLSEFYPDAEAVAPGVETNGSGKFGPLRSSTVSTLTWKDLQVGGDLTGPFTEQHVWTAPRAVRAAVVRTASGEAEKFLFYRGVAHIDAPLAISQNPAAATLVLRSQCAPEIAGQGLKINSLWLVDIRPDGQLAFRAAPHVTLAENGKILGKVSSHFDAGDYSVANRGKLKASLQRALVTEGLFGDEAQALLNTWELSYFKSAGLRVFFLVPRAWTDFYLPLNISRPADLTRVMVGRIELVTPEQRDILRQIGQLAEKDIRRDLGLLWTNFYGHLLGRNDHLTEVNAGRESLAAFGVSVPKSYQIYLSLGRFRNALILDEARQRPAAGLDSFISSYRLQGYAPVEISAAH